MTNKKKLPRRRCKCQVCKKSGFTDEFYRVQKGNRNLYYCTEDEYINHTVEMSNRTELIRFIATNIWRCENPLMVPHVLQKRLKELAAVYNYEVILRTVIKHKDTLAYWMNLEGKFDNDHGKSSYFMAIINNNINFEYRKWKEEQGQEELQEAMDERDMLDVDILNSMVVETEKPTNVNDGILKFLREGDL